jgi:type I restriction enzyme, S subunit
MELKPGYKQTEVGVIPEDWDVQTMATLAKITTGPFGTLLKASEYSVDDADVPLVSVGEVRDGYFKITEHTPRVPQTVIRRLPQYVLKTGDIVFGRKGAVDRSALVTEKENGFFLGSDGISIRLSGSSDPIYASYQLRSHRVRSWLIQNAIGTTMASLNQGILKKIPLGLPPQPEQKAIASALSDIDDLIHSLDELISKKQGIKQAAMQELLTGKRRLPGFEGEWEVKRLGDVLKFQVGCPFSSAFFNDKEQGLRLVKNRDLKSDDQVFHYSGKYDQSFQVIDGDVLVGMDGDFFPCRWGKGPALLNQRVGRIVPMRGLNRSFAFYYLLGPLKEIESTTSGTTVKHLSHGDIEDIEKPLPSVPEQNRIAAVLIEMDAELAVLEQRLEKTCALKQGMMQQLLTGKFRLR